MKTRSLLVRFFAAITLTLALSAGQLGAQVTTFNDATNDISTNIGGGNPGGGTLNIVKMEVVDTQTDVVFTMTVNGNITAVDWGNFMVGIANGKAAGTTSGNPWNRPISLNAGGGNGMTHWIGSWVGGGGGSQLWTYANATTNWSGPVAPAGFVTAAGAQSTITYTVSKESLGVTNGDTIIFDAYSSGGPNPDGAIDALANTNVTVTNWSGAYTSVAPSLTKSYTLANTALNTTQNITFSVDMTAQIAVGTFDPDLDLVSVDWGAGFANFQYLDDPEGDGTYTGTATISAPANTAVAYRFTIEAEALIPETVSRNFLMPEAALTIPTVFFNNIGGYRDVTFTVDMSVQETLGTFNPATQTVEVRGAFNNWAGTALTAQGAGIYSGTVTIGSTAGQSEPYKFYAAGPGALEYESVDNRSFTMAFNPGGSPTPALVLAPVFFSNQNTVPEFRAVTFSVNMSYQISQGNFDPATGVVQVRGPFNGWGGTALTAQGGGIYSGTINITGAAGSSVPYKFWATGPDWETINDRTFTLGPAGVAQVITPTPFFNNDSGQVRNITFSVDMSVQAAEGNFDPATGVVQLRGLGGFGDAQAQPLTRVGDTLVYSGTFSVPGDEGSSFAYKFWATGLLFEVINPNDLLVNRTTVLGPAGVAEVLPPVFFSNQSAPTPIRDVTFSVDMSVQIALGNFNPVGGVVEVRGPFNNWAGTVLTAGQNGIYSGTASVSGNEGASMVYKFYAANAGSDPVTPGWEAGGDRTFVLGAGGVPQTLPTVFFSNNSGQARDVTFSVDMSVQIALGNFIPAGGVVEVRGSFNGFAGGSVLTDQGGGIYSGTFNVEGAEGSSVAYKFFATNAGTDPAVPGYEAGSDRTFVLGANGVAQTLPTVFFSNNSGQSRDVTFSVDMSVQIALGNFIPAGGVVEVRGSFNDFAGGSVLTDQGGGIYSGTFNIAGAEGGSVAYKFFAANAGTDPAVPGYEAGSDRTFVLGANGVAQTLPTVFFSNNLGQSRDVTFSVDMSVQIALGNFIPAGGVVEVRGSFNGFAGGSVLTDQGGGIYSGTFNIAGNEGSSVAYKFYAANAGTDPAVPGFEAGSDRTFVLGANGVAQTLPTVFFSNNSGQARDVTFSVNMSVQIQLGNFDELDGVVEVRGSFNDWAGVVLTAQGGGIYSGTVNIAGAAGDSVAYKFYAANPGTDPVVPGFEELGPGVNRTFVLGPNAVPQVLPTVFFSNESGQVRDITFSVDMSVQVALGLFNPDETNPALGGIVQVRGIDGNFGSGPQLTRQGTTLVYSGTVSVAGAAGSTLGYKFWSPGINFYNVPGNDGFEQINLSDQFENRTVTLGPSGVAQILPTVFFSNQLFYTVGSAPNPFSTSQGTPSAAQSVTINGRGLTANIVAVAPTGFEVSADGLTYGPTANIVPTAGAVTGSNNLFVRIAASAAAGSPSGNVALTSAGSQPVSIAVSGTVTPGQTFNSWSGGQPLTPALQVQYAIGGASSPTATNGVPSVTTVTPSTLSITAIVRTNDPTLTVTGQTTGNLLTGPWTTNNVTVTVVNPQPANVPAGCQAQTFSTPRGSDSRRFLRLQTTLPAQP